MAEPILKQRGRYSELPLVGQHVRRICFSGFLQFEFDDPVKPKSTMTFWLPFSFHRFGYAVTLDPRNGGTLSKMTDLIHKEVTEAKADGSGRVRIEFGDEIAIEIEPGNSSHSS